MPVGAWLLIVTLAGLIILLGRRRWDLDFSCVRANHGFQLV